MLATHNDTVIAAAAECSTRKVARMRKKAGLKNWRSYIDWTVWDKLLGTVTDVDLAGRIGCTPSRVCKRREKLSIPAFALDRAVVDWTKWDALLGTIKDTELAILVGCSPPAVRDRRNKLGIAACVSNRNPERRIKWDIPQRKK